MSAVYSRQTHCNSFYQVFVAKHFSFLLVNICVNSEHPCLCTSLHVCRASLGLYLAKHSFHRHSHSQTLLVKILSVSSSSHQPEQKILKGKEFSIVNIWRDFSSCFYSLKMWDNKYLHSLLDTVNSLEVVHGTQRLCGIAWRQYHFTGTRASSAFGIHWGGYQCPMNTNYKYKQKDLFLLHKQWTIRHYPPFPPKIARGQNL